jgi:aldehyde:ferredoxin oxidoreductase
MEWEPHTQPPIDAAVSIADWNETMHYIDDSVGICAFVSAFKGQFNKSSYHINNYPEFISLATGMDLDQDRLWDMARRNRTLIRAINIRRGMRRKDEVPPYGHWKQRLPDIEKQLIDEYYKFKGWNDDGIPTKQELDRLELNYVSEDFIKRGILTDDKASPAKETSA